MSNPIAAGAGTPQLRGLTTGELSQLAGTPRSQTCVYPTYPLTQIQDQDGNTRTFQPGEPVCLRGQAPGIPEDGIYRTSVPQPGTGRIFIHRVNSPGFPDRWVPWKTIGKVVYGTSPTAVGSVYARKGIPLNLVSNTSQYGGKTRKNRKRKQRKLKKTRKH